MAFSMCNATFAWRVIPLFGYLGVTSSLFLPLHLCPAEWVIFLAAVTSFHGEQFLWVIFFLKMFLLRHATVAQRETFQQAEANFSWSAPFILLVSFGSWWQRSTASFRSLRHFFLGSPTGIIVEFSAGTSVFCATSDFLSSEVGFFSFRRSSVSRQANVSWLAFIISLSSLRWASILSCICTRLASTFTWAASIWVSNSFGLRLGLVGVHPGQQIFLGGFSICLPLFLHGPHLFQ
jgi:hypothetical protein